MAKKNVSVCDLCGARTARERRVTRSYGRGATLLVIEDVPVMTCERCGGTYISAETLHELERLKMHRRALAKKRPVPVVEFA